MKIQDISYNDYMEEVRRIYRDMRLEEYYYSFLMEFIEWCMLDDMSEKVIDVHKNRETKIHDRSKYADKHSVTDMIIVPKRYTYEKPTKPYVIIEVKMPSISFEDRKVVRYNPLKVNGERQKQLNRQFKHCEYIIFTDCIMWYFLRKDDFKKGNFSNEISLLKAYGDEWLRYDAMWKRLKCKIVEIINESKQMNV